MYQYKFRVSDHKQLEAIQEEYDIPSHRVLEISQSGTYFIMDTREKVISEIDPKPWKESDWKEIRFKFKNKLIVSDSEEVEKRYPYGSIFKIKYLDMEQEYVMLVRADGSSDSALAVLVVIDNGNRWRPPETINHCKPLIKEEIEFLMGPENDWEFIGVSGDYIGLKMKGEV